jgi:hypothetical protein
MSPSLALVASKFKKEVIWQKPIKMSEIAPASSIVENFFDYK